MVNFIAACECVLKADGTFVYNSTYILGVLILLVTSIPSLLRKNAGLPGLIISMLVISLGLSGTRAAFPPFIGKFSLI
jgi:hypothetical protein